MEPLNDNMDELFRQAGNAYPLKTDGADWDAVAHMLDAESAGESIISGAVLNKNRGNYRKYLLLLILLPLGLLSAIYFNQENTKRQKTGIQNTKPEANKSAEHAVPMQTKINPLSSPDQPDLEQQGDRDLDYPGIGSENSTKSQPVQKLTPYHSLTLNSTVGKFPEVNPYENFFPDHSIDYSNTMPFPRQARPDDSIKNAGKGSLRAKPVLSEIPAPLLRDNPGAKKTDPVSRRVSGRFYLSLMGAPDASTIKSQSVKGIGYAFGLLPGFRATKNLAIETGVFWDRKVYYSEGSYFNRSKTDIPPGVNLIDINGNCGMFEIPLNLRFDFRGHRGDGFYLIAGASSYLMKKENYDYLAELYNGQPYSVNWTYRNSGNNFFSIVNLGGGYQKSIGKIGSLRIEPYFKIPLRGVGIGSLPISSYGLYFGLMRSFK